MPNEPVHLEYQDPKAFVQPMSVATTVAIVGYALCLSFMTLYPFIVLGGWALVGQRSWLHLGYELGQALGAAAIIVGVVIIRSRPALAMQVIIVACIGLIAVATILHGYTLATTTLSLHLGRAMYYFVDRLLIRDVFPALLILLLARTSRFLQPR